MSTLHTFASQSRELSKFHPLLLPWRPSSSSLLPLPKPPLPLTPLPRTTHNPAVVVRLSIRPQFSCDLRRIGCTKNPNHVLNSIAKEGSAWLVMGLFLFLGQLHFKPALATVTPQSGTNSQPSPVEEKSNAPKGEIEKKINKNYDEMLEMYERYLERNPKDTEALKIVLYGMLRKGDMEAALKYIERLEILEPGEVEWRLLEAEVHEKLGKVSEAKNVYREILKEKPLLIRALHGLALVMHKNDESSAALEMLNDALQLASCEYRVTEERNIKILIATMHILKGDINGALKNFEDITDEDPRDFRPYLCKAILYSLLDKKKEADVQLKLYKSFVPDEYPQKGFLDDCIRSAKVDSQDQLGKAFPSELLYRTS